MIGFPYFYELLSPHFVSSAVQMSACGWTRVCGVGSTETVLKKRD